MPGFDMKDYVPVNERIEAFYRQFPEGSIQGEVIELTASRVTVKAYAYRNPEDPRPGIGHSSLDIPGSTTFTRGSEVENAETSAWGRAIAALGFEVKRGIASHEEVRNKQPGPNGKASGGATPGQGRSTSAQYRRGELMELMAAQGLDVKAVETIATNLGIPKNERPMSSASMDRLIEALTSPGRGVPTASPAPEQPSEMDGDGAAPVARGGESSESPPPTAGPEGAVSPSLPSGPALDPQALLESAQAIVGGELVDVVPPELQARIERARAKGKGKEESEQASLAEALGSPVEAS
jgi:hypothetical protein